MADGEYTGFVKICTICGEAKPATTEHFHPNKGGKYGLRGQCIECRRAVVREQIKAPELRAKRAAYMAEYVASGRNAERNRSWRSENLGKARASTAAWKARNPEKVRVSEQTRRDANREKVRAKQRRADAKLQQKPEHVLKKRVKARLRQMLKGRWTGSTEELLGYTREDLKRHIERQFTKGMTWDRLMAGEIHIDHIIPVSAFKITSVDDPDFKACWALTNLRPLWAADNQRKQAKVLTLL